MDSAGVGYGGLQGEYRRIDEEFQRRSEELLQWRLDAMTEVKRKLPHACYSVGTNQFHIKSGRSACTPMSVAAALYVLNYVASDVETGDVEIQSSAMRHLPWETIGKTGARLWREYMRESGGKDDFVEVGELLRCGGEYCDIVRKNLEIVEEMAGHVDAAVVASMDPDSLVRTLAECAHLMPDRSALVVTATSPFSDNNSSAVDDVASTVVIMRLKGDVWWVFDSHGGPDTNTSAFLASCMLPEAVEAVLKDQLPNGLFSATLFKRKRRQ